MIKHFLDIPQQTRSSPYKVDVSWRYLRHQLKDYEEYNLDLDPDFQRLHVWTKAQQTAYVEYILSGGLSGKAIYWNHPAWQDFSNMKEKQLVIVDGKQRIHAVTRFLNNHVKAFGQYHDDFEGSPDLLTANFQFFINNLKTKAEVLKWYLEFNSAGTPHTQGELDKVKFLLEEEDLKKED